MQTMDSDNDVSINSDQRITRVGDINNGRGDACGDPGSIWEMDVPSPQFSCEPKTV